jgi:hypothetical protein
LGRRDSYSEGSIAHLHLPGCHPSQHHHHQVGLRLNLYLIILNDRLLVCYWWYAA